MVKSVRFFLSVFLLLGSGLAHPGLAQNFPTRPIEIVVPFGAGSNTDRAIMPLLPFMEKELGVKVLPNYKAGGGATIGTAWAAKQKPDGHTLEIIPPAPLLVKPLTTNLPYSVEDFVPIAQVGTIPTYFVVRENSNWQTLNDLIRDAKQSPDKYTFATSGPFSIGHVAMEGIKLKTGVKVKHIPFEGTPKIVMALNGGQVDFAVNEIPAEFLKDGKIRLLATMTGARLPEFPSVPTLKELGYDAFVHVWYCFVAPKGTPQPVIDRLEAVVKKASETKEVRDSYQKIMGLPMEFLGSKEMAAKWERELAYIREVVKALNLEKQ
jgi:tripartite-type tricarboxylate transporter receptor subunit TctC